MEQAITQALAVDPAERFQRAANSPRRSPRRRWPRPKRQSVAVLPFLNMSADPENEFFADGITEDVIAQLSKIRSLKVISRASVMPFKKREQSLQEIGAALDVANLLEGSIRRAGSRVRIVAQLIDAETDRHLWAETYDRELTDIFAIQSDVALQIAAALEAELSPKSAAKSGRSPPRTSRHTNCISRAGTVPPLDPGGYRSGTEASAGGPRPGPRLRSGLHHMAMAYTDMAIGVAGSLPSGRGLPASQSRCRPVAGTGSQPGRGTRPLGHLKFASDYDWIGAERELKRAIELNPNSGEAYDYYGLCCPPWSATMRRSRCSGAPTSLTPWPTAWTWLPPTCAPANTTRHCTA